MNAYEQFSGNPAPERGAVMVDRRQFFDQPRQDRAQLSVIHRIQVMTDLHDIIADGRQRPRRDFSIRCHIPVIHHDPDLGMLACNRSVRSVMPRYGWPSSCGTSVCSALATAATNHGVAGLKTPFYLRDETLGAGNEERQAILG